MALPGISQSGIPSSSCCWPHMSCCPLSPLLPHGCLFPALKTNTPLVFWTPPLHTAYGLHSCSYHHFSLESSNSSLPPHFPIRALMCFNGSLKNVKSSPDSSLLPVSTLFPTYSKTYWKHLILRVFSLHPTRPPSFPLHRDFVVSCCQASASFLLLSYVTFQNLWANIPVPKPLSSLGFDDRHFLGCPSISVATAFSFCTQFLKVRGF